MRIRFRNIFAYGVILLVAILAIGITLTIGWRPFIGPRTRPLTNRTFEANPARLLRGQYLAENVMGCFYCHSERDWKAAGAPPIASRKGAGAPFEGGPGKVFAPNITADRETGVGAWSDDMLARAIREGVDNTGKTIFPIMPYLNYKKLSDEDLASLIVYLRTIPAVSNEVPPSEIVFPVNRLINAVPEPISAEVPARDLSNPIDRGQFLAAQGSCTDCHTPSLQGTPIAALAFAGGFPFNEPSGPVVSTNITPDPSGISFYDENMFVSTMRTGHVGGRKLNPTMPFDLYGKMTDEDLKAILAYLRTLTPVSHRVDNTEPPTPCKLCKASHGLGDKN